MHKRIRVGVIFGGTNTEHEVSIVSARAIAHNLNPQKYHVIPIKISKSNHWFINKNWSDQTYSIEKNLDSYECTKLTKDVDIVFPVIHGPFGEDGTLQGLLEMFRVPYVGSGVSASANTMDKAIQKQLCVSQNIPQIDYMVINHSDKKIIAHIETKLTYPMFIKPARQGSSVGVSKASNTNELINALRQAFKYDLKIIVEKAVPYAREIECAVLGNHRLKISVLGEIVPSNEFYDYDAKYIDGKSKAIVPAKLDQSLASKITSIAKQTFRLLECRGLARIDFLINGDNRQAYLNEVNSIPGFTPISMYPKLMQKSGISYPELLDKLINLGIQEFNQKQTIKCSYQPKLDWHN